MNHHLENYYSGDLAWNQFVSLYEEFDTSNSLTKDNTYSYIIYRNSIDNTLSPIEQETILQAIIEHFGSKGQKVLIE